MNMQDFRTTHDLADYLEDIAKGLRFLPPVLLEDARIQDPPRRVKATPAMRQTPSTPPEELKVLADEIRGLTRDEAENHLLSLSVASIREVGRLVGIRLHSKAPKDEHVERLLLHLFDMPRGAEVIRNLGDKSARG